MMRPLLIIAVFLLSLFSRAQDSYAFKDFAPNIHNQAKYQLITKEIDGGFMSMVTAFPLSSFPRSIVVFYHDNTGKMLWQKRHDFPTDLEPRSALVINNEVHVVGLCGRSEVAGSTRRGAFSLVLNADGTIKYYKTIELASAVESVGELHYMKPANQYVTDLLFAGGGGGLMLLDNKGDLTQCQRYTNSYCLPVYDEKNDLLRVMSNQYLIELDKNLNVKAVDSLTWRNGEEPFRSVSFSKDSIFIQTAQFQPDPISSYYYYLILYQPSTKKFQRLVRYDEPINEISRSDDKGYYLNNFTGGNFQHYRFDSLFVLKSSAGQNYQSGSIMAASAFEACSQRLVNMVVASGSDGLLITKTGTGWNYPGPTTFPLGFDQDRAFIDVNSIATPGLPLAPIGQSPNPPNHAGFQVPIDANTQVIFQSTVCALVKLPFDSLMICGSGTTVTAINQYRDCAPPTAVRSYQWTNGGDQLTNVISSSGWHSITVSEDVCVSTDSAYFIIDDTDIKVSGITTYCNDLQNIASLSASTTADEVHWNNEAAVVKRYETNVPGYTVATATSINGCVVKDSILISELCDPFIFIPSAFSPDEDGNNEEFVIAPQFTHTRSFDILDRWGNVIYTTKEDRIVWNGTYNGAPCAPGMYLWSFRYVRTDNGEETTLRGTVSLFR